jgi:hypothetical protein
MQNVPKPRRTGAPQQDCHLPTSPIFLKEKHFHQPLEGLCQATHHSAPCMEGNRQGDDSFCGYEQDCANRTPSPGSVVGWAPHVGADSPLHRERSSAQPSGWTSPHCWHICNPRDCVHKLLPLATWRWDRRPAFPGTWL